VKQQVYESMLNSISAINTMLGA